MNSILQRMTSKIGISNQERKYVIIVFTSIVLKFLYFHFSTVFNAHLFQTVFNVAFSIVTMLLSNIFILVIFLGILILFFNKRKLLILIIIDTLGSILIFSDNVYYRYYNSVLSVASFYQISFLKSIGASVFSFIRISDIIYFIDIPLIIAFYKAIPKDPFKKFNLREKIVASFMIITIGTFGVISCYLSIDKFGFSLDKNYMVTASGVLYYHFYDIKEFAKNHFLTKKTLTKEEKEKIDSYFKSKPVVEKKYTGIAKGKNLLVVQVEALQQFVINKSINGKEITPNLNKLSKNSIYFDNFLYQTADGNTADAEFLCNTSLYPLKVGSVNYLYPLNNYYTLAKTLKANSYNTYSFHAYNPTFWNRSIMHKTLGFDKFYAYKDYIQDDVIGWSVSDTSFFRQSLEKIDKNSLFYGFLITLSSHHPFEYVESTNLDLGEYKDTILGNYLKSINYVDTAIGNLIKYMKQAGIYDNTVLVMYGDHKAISKPESAEMLKFLNKPDNEYEWQKLQKVPCFIHCPGIDEKGTKSMVVGELDLFPTIANLLGINAPFAMGKDMLNTKKGYAVLRDGSVITDRYFYIAPTGMLYDAKNGEVRDYKNFKNEIEAYRDQLKISDLIIEKNVFKK